MLNQSGGELDEFGGDNLSKGVMRARIRRCEEGKRIRLEVEGE